MIKVAIIGGTGYKKPDKFSRLKGSSVETPYGIPVSEIYEGKLNGQEVIYLSRSGNDNSLSVTGINYLANIYVLKQCGCEIILSTCECASLQEEICPGDFIIPDQFIDLTVSRMTNLHHAGDVVPIARKDMENPFSEELRDHLTEAAIVQGITVHNKGTVITTEGYRYATRAESNLYRIWGGDIIDMSTSSEAITARMLNIPFAQVSLCTAYDNWRTGENEASTLPYEQMIRSGYEKIEKIIGYTVKRLQQQE